MTTRTSTTSPSKQADDGTAAGRSTRIGRAQLVLLGWRMSVATADGRRRLLLAGLGASLAILVLLVGLAAVSVREAQQERAGGREPTMAEGRPADGLAVVTEQTANTGWPSWFRGRQVSTITAAPLGKPTAPPGLTAFPEPGTIAASPEFARLHADDALFAARYPGRVTEIIGPDGLTGPNEIFAWISVASAPDGWYAAGYGPTPSLPEADGASDDNELILQLGFLLFVLPVLMLVGTSTRLGSGQRDQRMAAMRLVGATPGEVRLVSAAEAAIIGVIGVAGGGLLFLGLRPFAGLLPVGPGVFSSDVAASPGWILLIALTVPLLGIVAGYLSQRRVVASPLGVTRRATPRRPGLWRLVPLAVGLSLLLVLLVRPGLANDAHRTGLVGFLLLGGAGLSMLGLVLAAPLVGAVAAGGLLRIPRLPLSAQIGARRVQADPKAASRIVTGATVLAFVVTWLLASFLPVLDSAETGYLDEQEAALAPGTVTGIGRLSDVVQLEAIPGVRAVVPAVAGHYRKGGLPFAIVDCSLLSTALRDPLPDCSPGTAYRIWNDPKAKPARVTDLIASRHRDLAEARFSAVGSVGDAGMALNNSLQASLLLPAARNTPRDLPGNWGVNLIAVTDGTADAVEAVKTVMYHATGTVPMTMTEERLQSSTDRRTYQGLALAYLGALCLVAAVSLAVAMADDLRSRRQALAGLAAAGTPAGTLRRAGLVQLLLTLLPAMGLSLFAATVAAWTYSGLGDPGSPYSGRPFDGSVIVLVGLGVLGIVVAAYALTLPTLRSAVDVRGLRTG